MQESLTPYEQWQLEVFGNILPEINSLFSPDEDDVQQDI